mmetsp:Transcript_12833/g.27867  ORF Transcript_12833/g.27867 Transcript_12833/m.27867 type:complete len:667 (+) Transcript_12833:3-2003(+)
MRGSFRVAWRPDGSFIQLKPSSTGAQILVQSRPEISPGSSKNSDSEEPSPSHLLLQTHQKHSTKAVDKTENNAPIFTLPKSIASGNEALFNALEDYSNSSAMCPFNTATQQVIPNSFSLLVSLNGKGKTAVGTIGESRRLEAVSTWLKNVVSGDTMQAISAAQSSGDIYGSVLAALSGGDVATASSLALDSGNPRLSLMLANTGIQAHPFCDNQLEEWRKSGAQPFTPNSILRIFSLCSGSVDIERAMFKSEGVPYNIDWRRRFGMYLWSCSHSQDQTTVSSIVKQYGSDVSAGLAPPATPLYCDSATQATNQCILYQVLNHYEDADMPLANIVSPSSHTPFHHDFSASFHLCASMTALSSSTMSSHQEDLIVDAVTSQLIGEGFWEWAVYASLCFIGSGTVSESSAFARRLRAKNIISRFYSPSTDPSAGSRRSFLQNIGIPPQWFVEAHAYRCASEGDVFGMLDNLMRFSAADAMTAMERLVIPHLILEGKKSMKELWHLLELLRSKVPDDSIDCWNKPNGCGMFHQFLELWSQVEKLSNMSLDNVDSCNVDIDHLLEAATDLEAMISKATDYAINQSSLPFTKIRYGFRRTPTGVVLAEVGAMLSILRVQLLAIKSGQPAHDLERGSQMSLTCSSQLAFALTPDGLYDSESILRGFCGFKTLS